MPSPGADSSSTSPWCARAILRDDLPVVAIDAEYDAHTVGGYVAADLDLTATTQLTVSRAERQDRPGEDYRLFDCDQTHNASVLASYRRGPWLVSGRWQLATGTPYTQVVGATYMPEQDIYQPIYGALNGARLESSHELDLRVERQWRFQDWSLAAFLDVSNVYQNASVMQYQYNEDYTERKAITEFIPPPSLGLRGEF